MIFGIIFSSFNCGCIGIKLIAFRYWNIKMITTDEFRNVRFRKQDKKHNCNSVGVRITEESEVRSSAIRTNILMYG